MTHNPEWHREYLALENAERAASMRFRAAAKKMEYKRRPANAETEYAAALEAVRAAGKARWDFEMGATQIADAATLPTGAFFASLRGNH